MIKKIQRLEKVEIKNLWGESDVEWQLDPKVNILIGINGSGKTTVLELINSVVKGQHERILEYFFEQVKLNFDNDIFVSLNYWKELNGDKHYQLNSNFKKSKIDKSKGLSDYISLDHISTFDMTLRDKERMKKDSIRDTRTELDIILYELIEDFKGYQLKLRNLEREEVSAFDEEIRQLSEKDKANSRELKQLRETIRKKDIKIEEIYRQKNLFLSEINDFFKDTEKKIDFDKDNSIIFHKAGKVISPYKLSSGEKQLLIILLKIILQENQHFIVLMDEPELSLHLTWQLKLIETITKLNENCQLIVVTHSAGVFSKGWRDKITKMEDIIKPKREEKSDKNKVRLEIKL